VLQRDDPYAGQDPREVLSAVADAARKPEVRPEVPDGTPPAMLALLRRCWAGDPAARPAAGQVVEELQGLDPAAGGPAEDRLQRHKAARSAMDEAFPPHMLKMLLEGRRVEPEEHVLVTASYAIV
jgi:hypothetical protein